MYGRFTAFLRLDIVPISYDQRKEPYVFTTDIVRDSYPIKVSYDIVHALSAHYRNWTVTGPRCRNLSEISTIASIILQCRVGTCTQVPLSWTTGSEDVGSSVRASVSSTGGVVKVFSRLGIGVHGEERASPGAHLLEGRDEATKD